MKKPGAVPGVQVPGPGEAALINPVREAGEALVPARAVLTFSRPDGQALGRMIQATSPPRHIWDCAVRQGVWRDRPLTVVGPAPGAPYAAMVLEKLIALGARMALALSWCGSLQPGLGIGTLVLAAAAIGGDGTSRHYSSREELEADRGLYEILKGRLAASGAPWLSGPIFTTDAFYRETAGLVEHCRSRGVLGLDLELAALFAVGRHRRVPVAGLAVVSDELATLAWRPGHRSLKFRQGREAALRVVLDAAAAWEGDHD